MGLRMTTWNVNGIRNPFGYAPWNQKRSFQASSPCSVTLDVLKTDIPQAMFDILEADIVIMQEAKIQRKDLTDDMVLVSGWDVFFSLPKDKKGKNSKCCPIRAEEGLIGVLCPPKSTTKFRDLPADQRIGGYPREDQLIGPIDEVMLDSEGRCVILEFPAFVLIGVYVPATRDDTRTDFRMGFMSALDARIRNLVAMGKQVVLAGDLNIIRTDIDTAGCAEHLRKEGMTLEDFLSMPSRRFFNQLIFDGQVIGERDEGREEPVMWDITRGFHPDRQGMFTCWETKKNARPGNFGSRIDYILCTAGMKDWFEEANIQEGLMGSDHCPVYATMADCVRHEGQDVHLADIMNPEGMYKEGKRLRDWDTKDLLPQSAKLMNEFDRRRSIKDMFTKKPAPPIVKQVSTVATSDESIVEAEELPSTQTSNVPPSPSPVTTPLKRAASSTASLNSPIKTTSPAALPKRSAQSTSSRPQKKAKTGAAKDTGKAGPAQSSLMGFFKPKTPAPKALAEEQDEHEEENGEMAPSAIPQTDGTVDLDEETGRFANGGVEDSGRVFDPVESKESWSKLLGKKKVAPKCEHGEPCISYVVKKAGINCGRTFYMCSRPLGPSGQKEKNTQWRCATFIWARSADSKEGSASSQQSHVA
ncbi:DNA-(Apurinic or apyrimidinic site) lyase 2 [Diaporthe amygdali]|uniref:DNA-(Apurinic or apyrimidinic site) lyase 2 n=1 Tax=Phomopsis amygdali TaxID=1214568 RepID=UPI0022FE07AE|nr:DNA-(Apurinic or apyrimidinic site) lyase 2 [Diaporthe amygdali]KAJ0123430.1 DNA-(Apurinic or apyrimidinic site) lyase 2 [Diaporthe amygdali]